jgi:hypothetical protein
VAQASRLCFKNIKKGSMKKLEIQLCMGIDVQIRRDCPYVVLDNKASCISSGWLEGESNEEICEALIAEIHNILYDYILSSEKVMVVELRQA